MKRLTLLLFTLLAYTMVFPQQEPMFAQYRTNAFVLNPAVAGTQDWHEIRLNYRSQWSRFPGAPRTAMVSYQGPVDDKSGVGLIVMNDALGPSIRNGVHLAYAFRVPMGQPGVFGQNNLSFGMGAKVLQYSFRSGSVYFQDQSDVAIYEASEGLLVGDVAFGAWWYNDRFFAGFSAPNLIQSQLNTVAGTDPSRNVLSRLYRHYFALAGYRFVYDAMSVEASVLVKKIEIAPYQIEGNVKFFMMEEKIFAGISYRTDWMMGLMFGIRAKHFNFSYAADFMSRDQAPGRGTLYGPSNEFTLGFDLSHEWKIMYRE